MNIGENVDYKIEKDTLTIIIDLTREFGESKSGKSIIIASTRGNKKVNYKDEKIAIAVNIYKPKPKGD